MHRLVLVVSFVCVVSFLQAPLCCLDRDNDGICNDTDNCINKPNNDQADSDDDGWGDVCDNCPDVPNNSQVDSDGNGIGDACDEEFIEDEDTYEPQPGGSPEDPLDLHLCSDEPNWRDVDTTPLVEIPVHVWVAADSETGAPVADESAIATGFNSANAIFQPVSGITFQFSSQELSTIDSFFENVCVDYNGCACPEDITDNWDTLRSNHYKPNVLNVYIAKTTQQCFKDSETNSCICKTYGGWSRVPGNQGTGPLIKASRVDRTTLAHELGHFFGSMHTHEDCKGTCVDTGDPDQCYLLGDRICDTSPDPGTTICDTDSRCDVECSEEGWNPPIDNILSYYSGCRDKLTEEQGKQIRCTLNEILTWIDIDMGVCAPGETEEQDCGNCGTQMRSCDDAGNWGPWGSCSGEGVCSPNTTDTEACGNCGVKRRTCNDSCQWGPFGECEEGGECTPNQQQEQACGNCGTQTRTCQDNCTWGNWGSCSGEGPCSPNQTQNQSCADCGSQNRTCQTNCQWGSWTSCSCSNNDCCDSSSGCFYKSSSVVCEEDVTTVYFCKDGTECGQDVYVHHQDRYCSGNSSGCNGSLQYDTPTRHDDCLSTERCAANDSSCNYDLTCDCRDHASSNCYNDDVYWYDSCGNRQEKKEECPIGCTNGTCDYLVASPTSYTGCSNSDCEEVSDPSRCVFEGNVDQNNINGNTATITWRKCDQTAPNRTFQCYTCVGTCAQFCAERSDGSFVWSSGQSSVTETFSVWPSVSDAKNAACNSTKEIYMAGDAADGTPKWFHSCESITFTKKCN